MTSQTYKNLLDTKRLKPLASQRNILVESYKVLKENLIKLMEEEHNIKIKYYKQELCHQQLRHKLEIGEKNLRDRYLKETIIVIYFYFVNIILNIDVHVFCIKFLLKE